MASRIFLGGMFPDQAKMCDDDSDGNPTWSFYKKHRGNLAIIAKGNIIEGIEAKE